MKTRAHITTMKFEPHASQEAEKINRQAGMQHGMQLVTDQNHWSSMGIETGRDLALMILTQTYSDTYKEIHGIRPRRQFNSPEDAQEALEQLYAYFDEEAEREEISAEEEVHDEDLLPDLPSREGMGRRFTESRDGYDRLRNTVRRVLSESIDPRIQKRLDALLNDPKYADVFIKIRDPGGDRYDAYYSQDDGELITQPVFGRVAFRKTNSERPTGPCDGAWEVFYSRASKGWGSLLYEVALELAGPDGLVPDRFSVSADAKSVWDKYETRGDVKVVRLDVIKNSRSWETEGLPSPEQVTPDRPEDDCEQMSAVNYGGIDGWQDVSLSRKYVKQNTSVLDALQGAGRLIGWQA